MRITKLIRIRPNLFFSRGNLKATFTEDLKYLQMSMKVNPEDEDFVRVTHHPSRVVFTVETTGSMHPEEIVKSALKRLRMKLFELTQVIQKLD